MNIRILLVLAVTLSFRSPATAAQWLGDALDFPQVRWVTGGDATWLSPDPSDTHDGEDAAFALLYPFQQAWIETTIPGPGMVQFWWALNTHQDRSRFEFSINGVVQTNLATSTEWQPVQFYFPEGQQTLRWIGSATDEENEWAKLDGVMIQLTQGPYLKSEPIVFDAFTGSNYTLRAEALGASPLFLQWYRDGVPLPGANNVTLTLANFSKAQTGAYSAIVTNAFGAVTAAVANISLFADAIEAPDLIWASYGDASWFVQTNITHDGVDAIQTGALYPDRQRWFHGLTEAVVTGPGTVTWWWRVDTDAEEGGLVFFVDGAYQTHLNGVGGDWQQVTCTVSEGEHRLLWQYELVWNSGISTTRGWMDEVIFTPDLTRPRLQIMRTGSQIVVSWPAVYTGYVLESAVDATSGIWDPVTLTGVNTAAITTSGSQLFLRLRQQYQSPEPEPE